MKSLKPIRYKDWADFSSRFLLPFTTELQPERKRQFIFRGQADANWKLETTLDRISRFASSSERMQTLELLIAEFRRQTRGLSLEVLLQSPIEWELLGRHHGLPTTVLDFTRSPYVAAYFAFADNNLPDSAHAAIWVLDLQAFEGDDAVSEIELVDDDEALRFNSRAIEQEGLFVKIKDVTHPVESRLGGHLQKHLLPRTLDAQRAILASLQSMRITARNLFRDLDGAARSASIQVLLRRGE